jgi:hypothetical protein
VRRAGRLFDEVCAFANLDRAVRRAERGKRYRSDVLSASSGFLKRPAAFAA